MKEKFEIKNMAVEILIKHTESEFQGIIIPKLVHGNDIVEVVNGSEDISSCDALYTGNKDLKLGIKTADCAPVCFTDGVRIGVAHIGWRGLCAGLAQKMLKNFDLEHIDVYVAPYIHTFELQKDFCYDEIVKSGLGEFITETDGKLIFHSKDALASLLPKNAVFDERDTFETMEFPSFRRDATKERFYTIVSFILNS